MQIPITGESEIMSPRSVVSASSPAAKWDVAFWGLLGYLVIEYSRLSEMFPALQPLQLGKVAVALAVGGMILSMGNRRPSPGSVRSLDACLGFFLFVSLLSASFADYQESAWLQVMNTLQWCVIYFIVSRIASSTWRLRVFVFVLLLLNLKLAQFVIRHYVTVRSMRGEEFLAVHGVGAGSTGFFGNAGDLGVAMCVVWPLAGAMFVAETKRWRKWFFAVCFFAFLGAIVASSSRGAMVGAAVVALVSFLRSPKRIVGAFMMLGVVLAFFLIASGASRARMQSALDPEHDKTADDRLDKWRAGMKMFSEHPVLGVGPANYAPEYSSEHPRWQRLMAAAPHSIYVEGLSELGIGGFVPLLCIWLLLARLNARTRKLLRSAGPERCRGFEYHLSWGLDLALVGYLVSGAFLTVLYYPHLWVLLGLSAALHRATVGEVSADQAPQLENWKRATIRRELSPTGVR
jgi:O-antigen ligase